MTDTKRTLFAGFLIALLTLSIPFYLNLIGVDINKVELEVSTEKVLASDPPRLLLCLKT